VERRQESLDCASVNPLSLGARRDKIVEFSMAAQQIGSYESDGRRKRKRDLVCNVMSLVYALFARLAA
jgi:hypothetical protein